MDVLEPGDPENPSSRARASYIRGKVKRDKASPEEIAWLGEFEKTKKTGSRGASGHRKVTFTEEESASVGEGMATVAEVAAHAAFAREEGRREDSLADRGLKAMESAFDRQSKLVEFVMARMQVLEDAHLEMWARHRDSRIREVDAEIELTRAQAAAEDKPDQVNEMVEQLLPLLLKRLNAKSKG